MRIKNKAINAKSAKFIRENKKLAESLLIAIVEEGMRTGKLDGKNVDRVDLAKYVLKKIKMLRRSRSILWVIDHRKSILKEARNFSKSGKPELAILLYATWIEHFMNNLIQGAARRKGLHLDEIPDLIRGTQLKDKVSWLLSLLELPPIPMSKRKHINRISDMRNSFVHYKWNSKDMDDNSHRTELEKLAKSTEGLVTYLMSYEQRNVLYFSNRKLKKLLEQGMQDIWDIPTASE